MNYSVTVKNYLMSDIDAMASTPEAYALHPGKDFTRHRKISFKDLVLLPITMEAGTMRHEALFYLYLGKSGKRVRILLPLLIKKRLKSR